AHLHEQSAVHDDRAQTRLICHETDRIVSLVDRMEVFSDERPDDRMPVNIHSVLDHVKCWWRWNRRSSPTACPIPAI
ncbi:hypothetical protein ACCT11_36670, partial [Rhizobium johnstonii]